MCLTFWVMGGSTCGRKDGGREKQGFNPSSSDMLNQKFSADLKPLVIAGVVSRRAMFNSYNLKVGSNHVDFQVAVREMWSLCCTHLAHKGPSTHVSSCSSCNGEVTQVGAGNAHLHACCLYRPLQDTAHL